MSSQLEVSNAIEICRYCSGAGWVSGQHPLSESREVTCPRCLGSGRMIKIVSYEPFEEAEG